MASSQSKDQIKEFLRFFDVKRGLYVTEVEALFNDAKEARLFDDVYSKSDVVEMMGDLLSQIKERVSRDLEAQTNMSALVLEHVFASAEDHGVPLHVEMSRTEDEGALARIRDLNAVFIADADLKKKGAGAKLESIRDEHARLIADNQRMADENRALRERYAAMETQAAAARREGADVSAKAASLTAELAGLRSGLSASDATKAAHEAELAKLRAAVGDLGRQLEHTKTELLSLSKEHDAHVNQSKPYIQMQALLRRKNQQLAEVRAKLTRYEPEADDESKA